MRLTPARTRPATLALLVLLVAAAFAAAGCRRAPRLAPLPPDAVIVAFGDSLTHGTGAQTGASYPTRLAAATGVKVINAGVPGELSGQGLSRLPAVLTAHRPALVILCHGGNDLLQGMPPDAIADNLRAMIGLVRAHGAKAVLVSVPRPGLTLSPHPLYRQVAAELGVPCEDRILRTILRDRALKSDPIHPNADGYQALADALVRLLARAGALGRHARAPAPPG